MHTPTSETRKTPLQVEITAKLGNCCEIAKQLEDIRSEMGIVGGKFPTQTTRIIGEDYGSRKSEATVMGVESHENRNTMESLNWKEEDKSLPNSSMGLGQDMINLSQDMSQEESLIALLIQNASELGRPRWKRTQKNELPKTQNEDTYSGDVKKKKMDELVVEDDLTRAPKRALTLRMKHV